jgi:hypothetical protein
MKEARGDIWDWLKDGYRVVIPVNIGWKLDGANVMGRGLAAQAAKRYPSLPAWWGAYCKKHRDRAGVTIYPEAPLLLFPTKPLNNETPHLSWRSESSLRLVERSTAELLGLPKDWKIALPLVGCGNGKLDPNDVLPILRQKLNEDRFVLVR